jgi:arylsulfatase A-like enzyme
MKSFLFLTGLCLFSLVSPCTATPPNILFIMVDDLRPELGSYGVEHAKTPHIDRLVRSSMRFDRAYAQVPTCGASRASLMTGILPTQTRFVTFKASVETDAPSAATLPETFRKAGYTTVANGKVFHGTTDTADRSWSEPPYKPAKMSRRPMDPETLAVRSDRNRGRFYESPDVPDEAYLDGRIAKKSIEDLKRLAGGDTPFFFAVGFDKPHLPFYVPQKYWDLYDPQRIPLPGNRYRPKGAPEQLRGSTEFKNYHLAGMDEESDEFYRKMNHGYLASVSYIDSLIGDIMQTFDHLGLKETTIVVFWGDHGFHLGEHSFWGKHNTLNHSTRVPLTLRVPGHAAGATTALVESSDIFPTLCELAGLEIPETVQGKSFASLIRNPEAGFRENAYLRYQNGDTVITDRFSYTRYNDGDSEMLYDLEQDPEENINVAGDPSYATSLASLRHMLDQRIDEAESISP